MLKELLEIIANVDKDIIHLIDGLTLSILLGTLMGWIPSVTAIISLVWMCIKVYETKTFQKLIGNKPGNLYDNES